MMLQVLLGGIASGAVLLRLLWRRIRRGLGFGLGRDGESRDKAGSDPGSSGRTGPI